MAVQTFRCNHHVALQTRESRGSFAHSSCPTFSTPVPSESSAAASALATAPGSPIHRQFQVQVLSGNFVALKATRSGGVVLFNQYAHVQVPGLHGHCTAAKVCFSLLPRSSASPHLSLRVFWEGKLPICLHGVLRGEYRTTALVPPPNTVCLSTATTISTRRFLEFDTCLFVCIPPTKPCKPGEESLSLPSTTQTPAPCQVNITVDRICACPSCVPPAPPPTSSPLP